MIQNHCYKIIGMLFFSIILGLDFVPKEKQLNETLMINGKNREYYLLYKEVLKYNVIGPQRLEVVSRRAIPKESNKRYSFGYKVLLNNIEENKVIHKKRIMETISSLDHPEYGYTQSGKTIIYIPDGNHELIISPLNFGKPILIRLKEKKLRRLDGITFQPKIIDSIKVDELIINAKKRNYYNLNEYNKVSVQTF